MRVRPGSSCAGASVRVTSPVREEERRGEETEGGRGAHKVRFYLISCSSSLTSIVRCCYGYARSGEPKINRPVEKRTEPGVRQPCRKGGREATSRTSTMATTTRMSTGAMMTRTRASSEAGVTVKREELLCIGAKVAIEPEFEVPLGTR